MTSRDVSRPICIIGLGLIGGSLLRDLAAHGQTVYGYNRSTSGARSATKEGFDVSNHLEETLRRAETDGALIVLAAPLPAVGPLLDTIAELAPSCGITDVVSVKTEVYAMVKERGMEGRYVGGHPMAGTAESGWGASRTGLFQRGAWVIAFDHVIDDEGKEARVSPEWIALWTDVVRMIILVGAEAIPARVDRHDAAVARISHLPHVLAEALAVVGDNGGALAQSLAAGSFRDGTRVAATTPELVLAMCETNAPALLTALEETLELLQGARDSLAAEVPDLSELVDSGHRSRVRFEARQGNRSESVSPVKISSRPVLRLHPGAPGWASQLIQAESLGGRIEVF